MRLCRECKWFGDASEVDYESSRCKFPGMTTLETNYVDGESTEVYPTCQDMRTAKLGGGSCGCEGRLWEAKK